MLKSQKLNVVEYQGKLRRAQQLKQSIIQLEKEKRSEQNKMEK